MNAIADRIREAGAARRPLRIRGAGTWMSAGRPVLDAETLALGADHGIVEYVPGDLTLTARAGTRLTEITATTRAEGQWLPVDPWGGDDGTLGATVSTATAGPHSYVMGLPRDMVLGLEFVSGNGDVIRAGGRVVKNVAGFDLTRMVTGSWGTLGVITEVTVRLRARPDLTRTVVIPVPGQRLALNELATRLRALPFTPLASELLNARLAFHLGLGSQLSLLVQIGGNEKAVTSQLGLLRGFGEPRDADDDVWLRLRTSEPESAATWRWSRLASSFGDTWTSADTAIRAFDGAVIHGNPARGVVRVSVPSAGADNAGLAGLARAATVFSGTVAIESLPPSAWAHVTQGTTSDPVSRAIKNKFDPSAILNAGILGMDG